MEIKINTADGAVDAFLTMVHGRYAVRSKYGGITVWIEKEKYDDLSLNGGTVDYK